MVPEGHAVNVDDVEELFVEIHIVWRSNPLRIGTPGILSFDLIEIKNQDGVDVSHIIFIETNNIEIKSDNLVTFKVRVWMNEPEDQANYDLVAGKKIIVTGSYKVQPNFS